MGSKTDHFTKCQPAVSSGVKIKTNIYALFPISSLLSDPFKIKKSLERTKICCKKNPQKTQMNYRYLFLSLSEKSSSKHPVGFLTG